MNIWYVVYVQLILESRARVFKCECDFGSMHSLLSKLPQTMDVERVIARAAVLIHTTPPAELLRLSDMEATAIECVLGLSLDDNGVFSNELTDYVFDSPQEIQVLRVSVRLPAALWRGETVHAAADRLEEEAERVVKVRLPQLSEL